MIFFKNQLRCHGDTFSFLWNNLPQNQFYVNKIIPHDVKTYIGVNEFYFFLLFVYSWLGKLKSDFMSRGHIFWDFLFFIVFHNALSQKDILTFEYVIDKHKYGFCSTI